MPTLAQSITAFGVAGDVLFKELGASDTEINAFDTAITVINGNLENEDLLVTLTTLGIATAATATLVAALGPELIAAGVAAAITTATDEATLIGAEAAINAIIETNVPALLSLTSGSAIVGSTSVALGEAVIGLTIGEATNQFVSSIVDLFNAPNSVSLTNPTSGPVNVSGGNKVIIAQSDTITVGSGAQATIIGSNNTIAPAGNNTVFVSGGAGNFISLGSLNGTLNLSTDAGTSATQPATVEIVNATLGTTSFVDLLGNSFASYASSQLAGGTIKISGNAIDVWNSANQLQNSTQEIDLGGGVDGVLDKVWNTATPGITEVNILGHNSTYVKLRDDGKGIAVDNITNKLYFYDNGVTTPLVIPGITNDQGVALPAQYFVDDNNDIIARVFGNSISSIIYSGGTSSYTGGTTQGFSGPNGQGFAVLAVSNNGAIVIGFTQSASVTTWYARNNGTFTPINFPSYTDAGGFVTSTFQIADVNDNGVIAGYYTTISDGQVGATFNYQTGQLTLLPIQGANGGVRPDAIDDAGEVVGVYWNMNKSNQAFTYKNGAISDVSIPGITPHTFDASGGGSADATEATDITSNGTIVIQNEYVPFGNSPNISLVSYVIDPNAPPVTNTLHVEENGTIDLSSSPQFTDTTVNLSAAGNTTITLANNDSVNAIDAVGGDVVFGDSSNHVTVGGNGQFGNGDYVTISGGDVTVQGDAHADIYGGSNSITIGQNALVGVQNGDNNTLTVGDGSNVYMNGGIGHVVHGTNAVLIDAAGVSLSLDGGGNVVYGADGDTVAITGNGVSGDDNYITMSNGIVTVADNAHADIYGGGNSITIGQNAIVGVQDGNNNALTVGGGSQVYMNSGTGYAVNATNAILVDATGVGISLTGGGNVVYAADGDTVTVSSNGANNDDDYITLSNGIVNIAGDAHADVYGGGNTVNVGSGAGIGVQGGNGTTVTLGSTSSIFVNDASNVTINGGGSEQYHFASAFGLDTINNGTGTTANGSILFDTGVTDEKLWFKKSGNDLLIDLLGTTDQIKVAGWYTGAGKQVQAIDAGGLQLDTQIAQLVTAMASYQTAHASFNPQTATVMPTDTTLQNAITAAWHA